MKWVFLLFLGLGLSVELWGQPCTQTFTYDPENHWYECGEGVGGSYCASSGDKVMLLPCNPKEMDPLPEHDFRPLWKELCLQAMAGLIRTPESRDILFKGIWEFRTSKDHFQPIPLYFPPTNTRLDENFTGYLDLFLDAFKKSSAEPSSQMDVGGSLVIENAPHAACLRILNRKDKKGDYQFWWLVIEDYGRIEMKVRSMKKETQVEYRRMMKDGSYCDSTFSFRADARSPTPIVNEDKPKGSK